MDWWVYIVLGTIAVLVAACVIWSYRKYGILGAISALLALVAIFVLSVGILIRSAIDSIEHLDKMFGKPAIIFSAPTSMYEGDIGSAELIIDRYTAAIFDELRDLQPKDTLQDGRVTGVTPMEKSLPTITATLDGIGFTIVPPEPQKKTGELKWRWQIRADKAPVPSLDGEDRLLSVRLQGQVGSAASTKTVSLKAPPPRRIHVTPKTVSQFQQLLDWFSASSSILIPAAGGLGAICIWIWRRFKKPRPNYD